MKSVLVTVGIIFVFVFQNCTRTSFKIKEESNLPMLSSLSNGEGYSGKITFYVGQSDVSLQLPVKAESSDYFSIAPALPDGLSLNPQTGSISGTPKNLTLDYVAYEVSIVRTNGQKTALSLMLGVGNIYFVSAVVDGLGGSDADLTDSKCATAEGLCSLQAALDQSETNTVKTRIVLPAKQYLLGAANLKISSSVELLGSGIGQTVFNGQDVGRVLNIVGKDVTIEKISITHGKVLDPMFGAGIMVNEPGVNLNLIEVELSYNEVVTSLYGGGGIYFNGKVLNIKNSKIHQNRNNSRGGQDIGGGGIYFVASGLNELLVSDTTIEENTAPMGGGVYLLYYVFANHEFHRVNFIRNSSQYEGGAIYAPRGGKLVLSQSVFLSNRSEFRSGGAILWNSGIGGSNGNLQIENTTFSQNLASYGGALSTGGFACSVSPQLIIVRDSTFAENTSSTSNGGGAIHISANCFVELINSIIGFNGGRSCSVDPSGILGARLYNINPDSSCNVVQGAIGENSTSDPLLGPLTQYGNTFAYPLLPGSPAIDSGGSCLPVDQRNQSRLQRGQCDRGAFEK